MLCSHQAALYCLPASALSELEQLTQSRHLAYFGRVDWDDVSGVALCANPFAEEVLPLLYPAVTYHPGTHCRCSIWMQHPTVSLCMHPE